MFYWNCFLAILIVLGCIILRGGDKAGTLFGNLESSLISGSREPNADSFGSLYERWKETCGAQNIVLPRNITGRILAADRPWSLNKNSFQRGGEACSSLKDLLLAVKQGRRVVRAEGWPAILADKDQDYFHNNGRNPSTDSIADQEVPSYFVPHGCQLDLLDDMQACTILNKYSHVVFWGDSLGRHTVQGLMMMLTRDLVSGSFPWATKKTSEVMGACECDGQFSGNLLCRPDNFGSLLPTNPCSHLTGNTFALHYASIAGPGQSLDVPLWRSLCSNDSRPILLFLNGGVHYRLDANLIKNVLIDGINERIRNISSVCKWNLEFKITWTGMHSQSRVLDRLYPRQTRDKAVIFNEDVDDYVSTEYGMIPVNFWNLTKDAQTSDGLHSLSDVNIFRANALLHVAKFLLKDK